MSYFIIYQLSSSEKTQMAVVITLGGRVDDATFKLVAKRLTEKKWGVGVLPLSKGKYELIGKVKKAETREMSGKDGNGAFLSSLAGDGRMIMVVVGESSRVKTIVIMNGKRQTIAESVFFGSVAGVLDSIRPVHLPGCAMVAGKNTFENIYEVAMREIGLTDEDDELDEAATLVKGKGRQEETRKPVTADNVETDENRDKKRGDDSKFSELFDIPLF